MRRYLYALVPLLVLLAAISLSCILAYLVVHNLDNTWPLRKIIKKSTQLFLLLSIIPAILWLKLSKQELGFAQMSIFLHQILQGFALGFLTLTPVFVMLCLLGINVLDSTQPWTFPWLLKKLVVELLLALLVSLFEEPIFRGLLLGVFIRKMPVMPAVFITAFYYAILHFLDNKTPIAKQDVDFFSGFALLGQAFSNLLNPSILTAFSSLFLVGIFLGLLRTKSVTNLGLCIGCHTCWVWQIKMNKTLFNTDFESAYAFLVSSYDGVIGPLITLWLAIPISVYLISLHRVGKQYLE